MTIRQLPIAFLIVACVSVLDIATARGDLQVAVQTGVHSPDGNGDLSAFNGPTINNAGQLAFVSQLTGTAGGSTDNLGMFRRDTNGALTTISRTGDTFSGKSILTFFTGSGYISNTGSIGTMLALKEVSGSSVAFALGTGGALTQMFPTGMPSPSGQSNTLLGVTSIAINDAGYTAYRAVFNGAQPESGLYQRAPDGTQSVRLLNQTTAPRGGTITSTGSNPTLNESNQVGTILTVSTGSSIKSAVRVDGTTVHELVRQGDLLADGITTVGSFISSSGFINSQGKVALATNITQASFGGQAVILADDIGTAVVAKGVLPGFNSAATNMAVVGITDSGRVAFTADTVAGGSDPTSGIYLTGAGGPTIVALEDTAAPVPGKYFRGFLSGTTVANDAGQVAFAADLSDAVNGASTGRGVYFYDQTGGLQQVARTGDSLLGSTITNMFFFGMVNASVNVSPDTSATGLNGVGQVAFSFSLANGTNGVAIWSAPTSVPGDYNANGIVDAGDYAIWRKTLNQPASPSGSGADGNHSGDVDAGDYGFWRGRFGSISAAGSGSLNQPSIPEPTSAWLLMAGVVAMACCPSRTSEKARRLS